MDVFTCLIGVEILGQFSTTHSSSKRKNSPGLATTDTQCAGDLRKVHLDAEKDGFLTRSSLIDIASRRPGARRHHLIWLPSGPGQEARIDEWKRRQFFNLFDCNLRHSFLPSVHALGHGLICLASRNHGPFLPNLHIEACGK